MDKPFTKTDCACVLHSNLCTYFKRAMSNVAHRTDPSQKALQLKPHPAVATTHLAVGIKCPAVATMHLALGVTHPAVATMHLAMGVTHPAVAIMHLAVGVTRVAATSMPLAIKRQQAHPAIGLSCLPAMLQPCGSSGSMQTTPMTSSWSRRRPLHTASSLQMLPWHQASAPAVFCHWCYLCCPSGYHTAACA
jgi:hypothetical protein